MSSSNKEIISNSMSAPVKQVTPNATAILNLLSSDRTKKQFMQTLGEKEAQLFVQAARNLILRPESSKLRECDPNSIMRACFACAATNLSLEPSLGQAAVVPFGKQATFMVMKKGLINLALRSNMVATINCTEVYEGDIKFHNPFTGLYEYNTEDHPRENIIGYMSYIRLLNGYEKYVYKTVEQIHEHGKRYAKSAYHNQYGLWQTNFPVMASKTVLRELLTNHSILNVVENSNLLTALRFDQSTPDSDNIFEANPQYVDFVEKEIITAG